MAVGDEASAAGYPLVPSTGVGGEVHNGYLEINRTRDFVAEVKNSVLSIWTVAKGGTGSSTASGARTNLGIRTGTANPSDSVGGATDGNIYLKIQTLSAALSHQNSASIETGAGAGSDFDGRLRIIAKQVSQDWAHMTSDVNVQGILENNNNRTVSHSGGQTIERDISGDGQYNPSDFDFSIGGNKQLVYISHTFTIPHDEDGTKTVHFNVHYGITNTPTFGHDQQVGVSLILDPITAGGVWIRSKGDWLHAIPHVRRNGQWSKAFAYLRDGGSWKPMRLIEGHNEQRFVRLSLAGGCYLAARTGHACLRPSANLELSVCAADRRHYHGGRRVSRHCAARLANPHSGCGRHARGARHSGKDDIFAQRRYSAGEDSRQGHDHFEGAAA